MHKWYDSVRYQKSLGITEYASDRQIKEACYAVVPQFQHNPNETTVDANPMRLIVPRQVAATVGKAVLLYAPAVAASKAGEVPVTVTLKAVPVADVKLGIYPADITKVVNSPTNFCFSFQNRMCQSGTWPVKWTAKISSLIDSNNSSAVVTGTTHVVCRNAEWSDD